MDRKYGVICTELGESRGLGQFGKGRNRRYYKRESVKRLRRETRKIARDAPRQEM